MSLLIGGTAIVCLGVLKLIVVLCENCPVIQLVLEGTQIGLQVKAQSKVTPSRAIESIAGVFRYVLPA